MARFERLYIPHDTTVSNEIPLAGKRYCVVQRCLQVHTSIVVEGVVCPSWLAGGRLKGFFRLEPDFLGQGFGLDCWEVVVESVRWVCYSELAGGVLAQGQSLDSEKWNEMQGGRAHELEDPGTVSFPYQFI